MSSSDKGKAPMMESDDKDLKGKSTFEVGSSSAASNVPLQIGARRRVIDPVIVRSCLMRGCPVRPTPPPILPTDLRDDQLIPVFLNESDDESDDGYEPDSEDEMSEDGYDTDDSMDEDINGAGPNNPGEVIDPIIPRRLWTPAQGRTALEFVEINHGGVMEETVIHECPIQ